MTEQQNTTDLTEIRERHKDASRAVSELSAMDLDFDVARPVDRLFTSWRDLSGLLAAAEYESTPATLEAVSYGPSPEDREAGARSQAAEIATRLELAMCEGSSCRPSGTSWLGFARDVLAFLDPSAPTPPAPEPASAEASSPAVVQNATELGALLADMEGTGFALFEDVDGDPVVVLRNAAGALRAYLKNDRDDLSRVPSLKMLDFPLRFVAARRNQGGPTATAGVA